MSIAITAGAQSSLPGLGVSDPTELQWSFSYGYLELWYSFGAMTNSNSGTFFTECDKMGNYVTGMSDDTYATLCDVSGSRPGFMTTIIGPMTDTAYPYLATTTLKITVDGTEYEFSSEEVYTGGGTFRPILGANHQQTFYGIDGGIGTGEWWYARSEPPQIADPFVRFQQGWPYLNFNSSLKVEIKSDNLDETSSIARYAAVLWRYYK